MMNQYYELKLRQEKERNNFPIGFAFSDQQLKEGLEKLGVTIEEVVGIGGGGFVRKTDREALVQMAQRHQRELEEAMETDQTGEGFIFDMFDYELANHEFSYTWDNEPTLNALGITLVQIQQDERLLHGLKLAQKHQQGGF